ncbi:MAG: Dipeptide transport system permease protein DppC, partial [bacterium]
MSRRPSSRAWLPFWALLLACFATLPALADELQADRTEFAVGETVTLKIPGAFSLVKPKWRAIPAGIVQFTDKERTEAKVKGMAPGKVDVTATVDWKLGSTTYSISLNVTADTSSRIKPIIKGSSSAPGQQPVLDDPRMTQIGELLKRYEVELGGIRALFDKSGDGSKTPSLDASAQSRLAQVTEGFFKELGGMGLGVRDLQQFKEQYKAAGGGGSALFPGQGAWDDAFLGTERALMMGRAQLVQRLWMETLQDTFRSNPDAAVFGEIDIGSWVKMRLGDLGFQADIDFSSVSIDPELNRWIVDQFESKLIAHTGLDMVKLDALLTAHSQATADVFIGDWGKTFAELDMLKRSKWKVLKVEKNPDGSLALDENGRPRVRLVEKPGTQLFWEVAFRKLEAGKFAEVEFPKMDLAKEPMLSLEMLRHGIHDIEHGPYSRGQKLIKMLKYAERSYFMSKKAVAEFGFNPYAANDPLLAQAAEKIIANKNDPEKVADLLRALSGEEITADNVEAVTDKLVARAKTAMHDNAARALAFRLNAIAKIDGDAARQQAAEKLWRDLGTELDTFHNTSGEPPKIMVEAQDMAKAVMEGKLPPAELEAKANALHKLLNEAYKLPDSVIDRILMSDSVLKLKAYLRKLGWIEKSIDEFANKAKQKFPNVADFHGKVMELNEQLEKTTSGSGLLKAADWADNGFAVYEAYLNSDASDALLNAGIAMGRIGAQSYFPSMQIPFAVYDSLKSGSPKPLGMAVAFMYFPFAGQTYMVSGLMQRADVGIRDTEFYNALNKVLEITEFDTQGKITGFSLKNILGKEIDSESISPPGNRKAIVALFNKPESTFYTSPNFRYWSSLVPRQDDRFGRYENKLQNLRRFFGLSEDVRYMTVMLENFKAKSDAMPQDRFTAQRQVALQRMEEQLTETLWVAMADMLESAAKSVNVAELEAKVKKLEEDLSLRDYDLGKDKGLLSRIKWEIRQNSSVSWLGGENPYAVGLVYDKYIKAYERIAKLRQQIVLGLWHDGFGIDYVAAQGKPMKILLIGGKSGAPVLTGDPAKDAELAENTLAAHSSRSESMRADLTSALGRAVDADKDKEHLKVLGQIGLEWEHLLDDCAGRAAPNCEEGVRTALQQRVKLYKEYLAKLAAGNQALALEIIGPTEMKLGESADFSAKFAKPEDKSRPGLALNWSVNGQAAGNGEKVKVKAEQAGGMNLMLSATSKASGSEKKLGEAVRTVTVKDPTGGKPPAASANLAAEIEAALKARDWKRLVDRLDAEKKSDLKMKNVVAWQANIDALGVALTTLKNERMDWALAWRPYIDALDHIDSLTWDRLTRQVETKRTEVERRCWDNSSDREATDKRVARCQTEGRKFEESCVGTWPAQHWEEMKRIRMAKQELPDAVQLLHSAGYGGFRNWFEAVEKLAEKHKLPFPYPKPVTPRLKYALSCASVDLTAGKKPQDGLSTIQVRVEIPSAIVPYGKPVTLNASASGGKAPYTYAWSTGASGQRASVTPRWAGEWTVTVSATDADGKTGEGQGTLVVSPAKVKMNGTQPKVFYGSQATLSLPGQEPPPPVADPCAGRKATNPFDECLRIDVKDLKSVSTASPDYVPPAPGMVHDVSQVQALPETGPTPRAGKQRVVWQAEPAIGFAPPTSDNGRTRVTYSRMGRVKLWCEIQEMVEGAFHTVGECDQETVEVIAPKFSVSFTPPEGQGRIGQDIRLHIASEPSVPDDLIDFRWFDPATSNRLELTPNAREIGFKVKDAKPVVFKALARVPHHGDSIADIAATYTGLQFQVKAWAEEPGTRPMMWDPVKGGLKPVPRGQYATHERIPLRAELQGGEAPSGLRWNWTVNDGSTISNPISQTPTVSRSSPGGIEATVEARDAGGAVLGSGSVSLSVIEVRDTPPAPVNPTVSLDADRTSVERGQTVSFSANASGGKPPYRYAWQGASGQGSHATLAATRTGNQSVSVTVTDSKGNTATARLDISIVASARDIAKDKADKLAAQATQQAKAGDFEGAANSLTEANQHDAESIRPVASQIREQAKQAAATAEKKRDFKTSGRLFEAARRIDRNDQAAHIGANNAVAYQQRQDAMLAKQKELAGHIARGDWNLAETSQAELKIIDEDLPGGLTPETRDLIKRYQDGQAAYTRQVEAKRKEIAADIQAKRYDSARAKLIALRQTHLIPADVDWTRGIAQVIDQAEAESRIKAGAGAGANIGAGVSAIAGKWRTSEGELTLVQSGRSVQGSYTSDGGEIVGEVSGNVLEGWWIENGSSERCATAKNGRYYWGRIRWTFEGGRFTGNWSYCDKPVAGSGGWNGERTGDVPPGYAPPASASSSSAAGMGSAGSKPAGAISDEEWAMVETTPGMYRLERSSAQVRVARQANNPGGLQYAGLRLNRGLPASGDFSAQVGFADARIDGGLNQIELQATFADGSIFYVVRDRERSGSHIWAPNLQGDAPCGKAGVLRMERRGDTVTGYCDGRAIWSAPRKAALTRLQFVLQNNASNDPISVAFRDWRFSGSAGTATAPSSSVHAGGLSGTPRVAEFTWLGMDEDRVGEWGSGKPNGTRDGHFRLTLDAPGRFALPSLSVWSANEKGEKSGGQIWHTKNGSNWMLGVFRDGRQLNASHVSSLGEFPGRVSLDLYANSSGWFNPGQWFLLEMETADGRFVRQLMRLGAVGTSQGGTVSSSGGRDYTGYDSPIATPDSRSGTGYLRIEACVDGSDWISLDNGRL